MFVKFRSRVTRFATTARIAMPKFVQSRCSRPIFPSGQTLRDVTTPIIDRPVYKLNLSSRSRGSSSQRTSTSGYRYPPLSRRSSPLNLGTMRYSQFSQVFGRRRRRENFIFRWLVASFSRVVLSASCATLCRPSNSPQQPVRQTELKIPLLRAVAAMLPIIIRFSPRANAIEKRRFLFFKRVCYANAARFPRETRNAR